MVCMRVCVYVCVQVFVCTPECVYLTSVLQHAACGGTWISLLHVAMLPSALYVSRLSCELPRCEFWRWGLRVRKSLWGPLFLTAAS